MLYSGSLEQVGRFVREAREELMEEMLWRPILPYGPTWGLCIANRPGYDANSFESRIV